jgi:hypothetical protein
VTRASTDLSARSAAAFLVAAAVAVVAAGFPQYVAPGASYGNDSSSHFAEILAVADLLSAGQTDFWFDQTNLGYPLFLAYQPAPSLLMGALVALTRSVLSPLLLFKLSVLALCGAIPFTWYVGGRWLGLRRLEALLFALFALAVNDFRSFGLGLSALLANGLYTQAWGALFLPLAIGSLGRHLLRETPGRARPVLWVTLTLLCHAFLALFCGIAAALMVVVQREGLWRRARALLLVGIWVGLASAFWLVPFLLNLDYQGGLPWKHASENGYPPAQLLGWIFTGAVFDHGRRVPWLTVLVFVGLALAMRRRQRPLERWVLLLFFASFVLLLGRTTWGAVYGWLPFHGELEVVRYLSGLHFCGALLAAWAAAAGLERLPRRIRNLSGPAWLTPERTLATILAVLTLGFLIGLHLHARRLLQSFDVSQPDFQGALAQLSRHRDSRFLCHERLGSASHFYLNLLPALAGRPQLESYSRGYHDTLSLYYLEYFDFSEAAFRLYNVGGALAGAERSVELPDSFHETWSGKELAVLESDAPGYFAFVRTPITLLMEPRRARPLLRRISLPLFQAGVLPRLSADEPNGPWLRLSKDGRLQMHGPGESAPHDTAVGEVVRDLIGSWADVPIQSRVVRERVAPNAYRAVVEAAGSPERLLLKASYHPYWTAAVDGEPVPVDLVAPNLMAVSVPPGRHAVDFRFHNPVYQKVLFVASVAGALAWAARAVLRARRSG